MGMQKSRLIKAKQDRLIEHFVSGSTARIASSLVDISKTTVVYYYHRLLEIIVQDTENESFLDGEIELDKSYFGGIRKGKRGSWCGRKSTYLGNPQAWRPRLYKGYSRCEKLMVFLPNIFRHF